MSILRVKDKDGNLIDIPAIKGEKGDKGDQGIPGPQGIQGIQGEKGDKGDQGDPCDLTLDKVYRAVYPPDSYYWSDNSIDPGTLFGGTWTRIEDSMLIAKGDIFNDEANIPIPNGDTNFSIPYKTPYCWQRNREYLINEYTFSDISSAKIITDGTFTIGDIYYYELYTPVSDTTHKGKSVVQNVTVGLVTYRGFLIGQDGSQTYVYEIDGIIYGLADVDYTKISIYR